MTTVVCSGKVTSQTKLPVLEGVYTVPQLYSKTSSSQIKFVSELLLWSSSITEKNDNKQQSCFQNGSTSTSRGESMAPPPPLPSIITPYALTYYSTNNLPPPPPHGSNLRLFNSVLYTSMGLKKLTKLIN